MLSDRFSVCKDTAGIWHFLNHLQYCRQALMFFILQEIPRRKDAYPFLILVTLCIKTPFAFCLFQKSKMTRQKPGGQSGFLR